MPTAGKLAWIIIQAAAAVLIDHLTHTSEDLDEELEWRHVQCVFTKPVPSGLVEDKSIVTFDILNWTDGGVDTTWNTADYTTCEGRLDTFWSSIASNCQQAGSSLVQYRWYVRRFATEMGATHRFAETGPPVRITTKSTSGLAGGSMLPPQVAISVTERTPWPKHWGRIYIPGISSACLSSTEPGRIDSTKRAAVGTAADALWSGLYGDEFPVVVPVTQVDKQFTKILLNVTDIAVDDVFDVQRSRRAKQVNARSTADVTS